MLHEILLHVIIHGQHHRAQIATCLRQHGHTPPPTDCIIFTRDTAPA
ncbi:MAG: DinB family protein [Rhodothermales bacterium]